jgi:hypothetical protein
MAIRACQTVRSIGGFYDASPTRTNELCITSDTKADAVKQLKRMVGEVSNFCGPAILLQGTSTCPTGEMEIEELSWPESLFYKAYDAINILYTGSELYIHW